MSHPSVESSPQTQTVLKLLDSPSLESKFAALLLAGKLPLDTYEEDKAATFLLAVLQAAGVEFLAGLLSAKIPAPQASLAVSILSSAVSFAAPHLLDSCPVFVSLIPSIVSTTSAGLQSHPGAEDTLESLRLMLWLASQSPSCPGPHLLARAHGIQTIAMAITTYTELPDALRTSSISQGQLENAILLLAAAPLAPENPTATAISTWLTTTPFLMATMAQSHPVVAPIALHALVPALSWNDPPKPLKQLLPSRSLPDLAKGIALFAKTSPLMPNHRTDLLLLAGCALDHFGGGWIANDVATLRLLLSHAGIVLKFAFEPHDGPEEEESSVIAALALATSIMRCLTHPKSAFTVLPGSDHIELFASLKTIVNSTIVGLGSADVAARRYPKTPEPPQRPSTDAKVLLAASLLTTWAGEESVALKTELLDVLPFLLRGLRPSPLLFPLSTPAAILETPFSALLLPLSQITTDEDGRRTVALAGGHLALGWWCAAVAPALSGKMLPSSAWPVLESACGTLLNFITLEVDRTWTGDPRMTWMVLSAMGSVLLSPHARSPNAGSSRALAAATWSAYATGMGTLSEIVEEMKSPSSTWEAGMRAAMPAPDGTPDLRWVASEVVLDAAGATWDEATVKEWYGRGVQAWLLDWMEDESANGQDEDSGDGDLWLMVLNNIAGGIEASPDDWLPSAGFIAAFARGLVKSPSLWSGSKESRGIVSRFLVAVGTASPDSVSIMLRAGLDSTASTKGLDELAMLLQHSQ